MQSQNVVIQFASDDPDVARSTLAQVNNLLEALSHPVVELVIHSKGVVIIKKNSEIAQELFNFNKKEVRLMVCEKTLAAQGLIAKDLLQFVTIIPSAVAHLVNRQLEGWAYLKAGF